MNVDASRAESCPDWLLQKFETEGNELLTGITTVLWRIWTCRNMKVWENKTVTPVIAAQWSSQQISQWRAAQLQIGQGVSVNGRVHSSALVKWQAPVQGKFKINMDASVVEGSSSFSLGMILRDHLGHFCRARNLSKGGEVSVFEIEATGVLEAIRWVTNLGVSEVEIESDSLLVVQAINRQSVYYLEVGNVLQEIHNLLYIRKGISILHVKKQANKAAHMLARVPCAVN